jgi:hypothetical protein
MTFPANVSKTDLAQLLSVTPRRIGQLTDDKVLVRNSHGAYATVPSIAAYIAFKEKAAMDRLDGGADYNSARARKMEADAQLAELELLERAGRGHTGGGRYGDRVPQYRSSEDEAYGTPKPLRPAMRKQERGGGSRDP